MNEVTLELLIKSLINDFRDYQKDRLIEKGSYVYTVTVDGRRKTIPWAEIKEWIEKQYGIEQEIEE